MRRFLLNTCLLFFVPGISAQQHSADSCMNLDAAEFYLRMHAAVMPVLIDTRSWEEFRKERIKGAVLAESRESLYSITDSLDFDQPVFLYCEDDYRSPVACRILIEKGFRKLYNLEGGLIAWRASSYELDRKKLPRNPRRR